jgi:hypothetical protein
VQEFRGTERSYHSATEVSSERAKVRASAAPSWEFFRSSPASFLTEEGGGADRGLRSSANRCDWRWRKRRLYSARRDFRIEEEERRKKKNKKNKKKKNIVVIIQKKSIGGAKRK